MMNILIRGLSKNTVKELKRAATEKNRTLPAEIKAILNEVAERQRHLRNGRTYLDRIFREAEKCG
jgi:plasmid stability protein